MSDRLGGKGVPRGTPAQFVKPVPDTARGAYYTSVVKNRSYCLALGPFHDDHARALAGVERVRRYFSSHHLDPWAACAYGTCRLPDGATAPLGRLSGQISTPTDADVAAYLAAHPPQPGHLRVSQPSSWPFRVDEVDYGAGPCFRVIQTKTSSIISSYDSFAEAEHHRRFRTTPSHRFDLVGTGGGSLRLIAIGDPQYRAGYPQTWVVLARINQRLDASQVDWLVKWVHATHILVTDESPNGTRDDPAW
jgi:hypothetical protein